MGIIALLKDYAWRIILVVLVILALGFAANYVLDLRSERDAAVKSSGEWKKKYDDLDLQVKQTSQAQKEKQEGFTQISNDNIELLCAAKYGQNSTPPQVYFPGGQVAAQPDPAKPEIKEIIKWKEKAVPVDTADKGAEQAVQAISTGIAIGTLNNTYKAYCLAIDNEDAVCEPFKVTQ